MNMPPISGSICKTEKGKNGSLTACHNDYQLAPIVLWIPIIHTYSGSLSSVTSLHLTTPLLCALPEAVSSHATFCVLQVHRCSVIAAASGSPMMEVYIFNPGHFSDVIARWITGSARQLKGKGGSKRSCSAEQSLHLLLANTTSNRISWKAMTRGGFSINDCDTCPMLTFLFPSFPFFYKSQGSNSYLHLPLQHYSHSLKCTCMFQTPSDS